MILQRTFDIVDYLGNKFPDKDLFFNKRSGKWDGITTTEFAEAVKRLSILLISEGVDSGECVASIFSYNSFEWNIIDMALAKIGAIHLPVYPTISDSDYIFILNQAEVRWVFITDQIIYNKISQLQCELPQLKRIVAIEKLSSVETFNQLITESPVESEKYLAELNSRQEAAQPDDICTILYTSGTTGFPKGVMLSHGNLCSNTEAAARAQPLEEGDKVLSFLPLCHIYERTAVYQFILKGVKVYYAENLKAILANMKEIKPEGTTLVPRVLEKILSGLQNKAENSNFIQKLIILWSIRLGFRFKKNMLKRKRMRLLYLLANEIVYSSIRNLLGGHLKYVGCGGAPIDSRILNFFWAAEIPVYEGYGLTECSPLVALNYPGENNSLIGTVGPLLPDVSVKLADDGEIMVSGPNVMKGYYKNPEQTQQCFIDGWFCTGDLGQFIEDRFLKIIGRKKEMFKTSYGKYIVPQAIESKFLESQLIDHLIVIGEGRHFAAAIISPNFEYCRKLLKTKGIPAKEQLSKQSEVLKAMQKEINKVNRQLGKTERINKFLVVDDTWSVESGELSATQKLKRNIIIQKYSARIRDIYREDNSVSLM